ncbi:helix-turn-helix domain-containing protein [Deinococcus proteolyticus]|uniref:helix-turn-helix domain-containing protein n=1 Tax=Deinococcus proteolyticus TaxID=55148 RepID=UPI0002DD1610|nr:helix-turn-helix domain-containing protein [Deinococcus proteolyticus]
MQGDVLTLEELATFLKVSETTTYSLVRSGELPGRKVGREWRFVRSQILAWLMSGTEGNMAEANGMVQLGEDGGEYKVEGGREYVAMWLPLTRQEKAAQVEKAAREGVMLSELVADYLRDWAKED